MIMFVCIAAIHSFLTCVWTDKMKVVRSLCFFKDFAASGNQNYMINVWEIDLLCFI